MLKVIPWHSLLSHIPDATCLFWQITGICRRILH
jgi:hypothetical protein